VKFWVSCKPTLRPWLFKTFINDTCYFLSNSKYFLSADDLKIFCTVNNAYD
jgi:hypothetical protein